MNQPIFLTKTAFHSLLSNLLEIEEGMEEIFDEFLRKPSNETEELRQILAKSVTKLDNLLPHIVTVSTGANEFPYVVVGSEATIEDVANGERCCYKLISPLKKSTESQEVSFLSPMGKALLLKTVNDRFQVQAPGGDYEYKVVSIRITAGFKG